MKTPTLAILNANDNPADFDGELLGDDGHGNQLWLFRSIDKVANRWSDSDDEGNVQWDDDIAGWNYTEDFALE